MKHTKQELKNLVIQWATDRKLILEGNELNQCKKLISEVGELFNSDLENDIENAKLEIGDIQVCLIILTHNMGVDFNKIQLFGINFSKELTDVLLLNILDQSKIIFNLLFNRRNTDQLFFHIQSLMNHLDQVAVNKYNTTLDECLNLAYNKIKDRTGKTVNNTFIKD